MPRTPSQVLALALLIIGAGLRCYHYYYLQQFLLKAVIAVSIVTFVGMIVSSIGSRNYTDEFIFALLVDILCCLTYESAAGNGNSVIFEELLTWVRSTGTPDEKMALEAYWPALKRER